MKRAASSFSACSRSSAPRSAAHRAGYSSTTHPPSPGSQKSTGTPRKRRTNEELSRCCQPSSTLSKRRGTDFLFLFGAGKAGRGGGRIRDRGRGRGRNRNRNRNRNRGRGRGRGRGR